MKFTETSPNLEYNASVLIANDQFAKNLKALTEDQKTYFINEIKKYYNEYEWGLKIIARNVLGISYTNCRSIFKFLNIEHKKGRSVTSDFCNKFKKEKAIHETLHKTGFSNPELKRFSVTTSRGVQGYYFNKSTNSYVWLRSTYEYIYAKFLNKIGVNWKTEQKYYILSDKTKYSPDFYIYDENWNLQKIVEIKGYFDCRAYKTALLKEEYYKDSNIDVILIQNIKLYLEENSKYDKELQTWKTLRKSKESVYQELN